MSVGSTTCELVGGHWHITGDPFVMHRIRAVFPNHKKTGGEIRIPATLENARDLMWFRLRYPMKVKPESKMRSQCASFLMRQRRSDLILSADYVPEPVEFAKGEAARPYQLQASELLKANGCQLLADDLGTGKTLSAIASIADPRLRPALVVVPPHLAIQWQKQLARFLPKLRTHILNSTTPYELAVYAMCPGCGRDCDKSSASGRCPACRIRLHKQPARYPDVILSSYMKLDSWQSHLGAACKSVFFDEGHALRRSTSKKWKAAHAISLRMDYRCLMSATPIFNLGGEIWNMMECVKPGFLGPKDIFKDEWCGYSIAGKEPPLKDPDAFGAYLRDNSLMLRRTAEEVGIKLGECNMITHHIDASADVFDKATSRAGELARMLLKQTGESRKSAAVEFDSMLRQATGLAKAPWVCSFVEMLLEQGLPTVLFAWHRGFYDIIQEKLGKQYKPVCYTGSETSLQKEAAVHKFVSGESDLFVCSLRSGEGLDGIQKRSHTCVFGELDWSFSVLQQCIGRLNRDGQKHPVTAYLLLSNFGLDPIMAEVLDLKKDQLVGLIGDRATGPVKQIDSSEALKKLAAKYLDRR